MKRPDDWQHDHEVGEVAATGWPATADGTRVDDVRIAAVRPLIAPALLQDELPMSEAAQALVQSARARITAVVVGVDPQLIVVVGPAPSTITARRSSTRSGCARATCGPCASVGLLRADFVHRTLYTWRVRASSPYCLSHAASPAGRRP